ncbi:hypothetical protein JB92DRAFT_3067036, partial [Gautieria morchelliformis]
MHVVLCSVLTLRLGWVWCGRDAGGDDGTERSLYVSVVRVAWAWGLFCAFWRRLLTPVFLPFTRLSHNPLRSRYPVPVAPRDGPPPRPARHPPLLVLAPRGVSVQMCPAPVVSLRCGSDGLCTC